MSSSTFLRVEGSASPRTTPLVLICDWDYFFLFSLVAPLVWIIAGSVIGIVVVSIALSLVVAFVGKF